jgi:RNA polymerase sigma-70 factor (ECF subfamily)
VDRPDASDTSAWLIVRVRDLQDDRAWGLFWQRYEPRIRAWAIACGLGRDEVEEITSIVSAKLVKEMPRFDYDARQSFRGWLRSVVRNAVHDFWRDKNRRPADVGVGGSDARQRLDEIEGPQSESLVEELNSGLEERRQVEQQAVARVQTRVEARTWQAFWQTAVEGRKGSDVAHDLGLSVAAVHVARGRVARMLRDELADLGIVGP